MSDFFQFGQVLREKNIICIIRIKNNKMRGGRGEGKIIDLKWK